MTALLLCGLPHPAEVLEGLRADDLAEMLDDDTEALFLQLRGETPHLLGPLDFWEAADQLLGAAQHGYGIVHSLNGQQLSAKGTLSKVRARKSKSDKQKKNPLYSSGAFDQWGIPSIVKCFSV